MMSWTWDSTHPRGLYGDPRLQGTSQLHRTGGSFVATSWTRREYQVKHGGINPTCSWRDNRSEFTTYRNTQSSSPFILLGYLTGS